MKSCSRQPFPLIRRHRLTELDLQRHRSRTTCPQTGIAIKTAGRLREKTPAAHARFGQCDLRATAFASRFCYAIDIRQPEERAPTTMAYLISENRLFCLKLSEWSTLLVGVALCGILTLLF